MSVLYRGDRGWCDVCATPDGFAFVYSVDGAVVCEVNEQEIWRTAVPTDHLRYLRCASSPAGDVGAIGVGADDIAYAVDRHGAGRWGPVFGQNSVGLFHDGTDFVAVIQRSSESYSIGQVKPWVAFPPEIRGTSQGFRDVYPDGNIVFGDDAHLVEIVQPEFRFTLHKPNTRGDVIVGQINGTDQIDGWHRADRVRFQAIPGPAFEPHVAQRGLQYAICARTPQGAALVIVPPYSVAEEPMAQLDIIRAIRSQYPTPLGATHAQLLLDCAAQTKMGLLRKTGGTRIALPPPHFQNGFPIEVSQDILMDPVTGRIFDFLGDAEGAATPGWSEAVGSPQPLERIYVPTGDVPPPPPPDPPDDLTYAELLLQVLELRQRLTALENAKFAIEVVRR